jgi:hypothetical protein
MGIEVTGFDEAGLARRAGYAGNSRAAEYA